MKQVYDMHGDPGLRHIDPWMLMVMWNIWLIIIYDEYVLLYELFRCYVIVCLFVYAGFKERSSSGSKRLGRYKQH